VDATDPIAASERVHRRTGPTFYLATRFFPRRIRHATYALYGFFRVADEVVDDPGDATPAEQRAELDRIRRAVLGPDEPDDPVLAAFWRIRREFDVPTAEVETFLDAMTRDAGAVRCETQAALDAYMRGSAVAVGNMMLAVLGARDPAAAAPHAAALAEAFQLTNFVRDVREDVLERDRVYLPAETLRKHGASVEQVVRLEPGPGVSDAVRELVDWAERRYREGVAGIRLLPVNCQFPVLLAAVLYAEHHRLVRRADYDVLSSDPSISQARKVALVAETALWWWWHRDPEAVFYAVSAVSVPEARESRAVRRELATS